MLLRTFVVAVVVVVVVVVVVIDYLVFNAIVFLA